jgi:hypothetical protein
MCPTVLGRIETRTAILIGPAILGLILSLATQRPGWIVLIGIYLLVGVALDVLMYQYVIKWQPPWLTFVLGVGEFAIVYVLADVAQVGLKTVDAVWFFWASWVLAVWTRIVILPLVSLTWIEDGGEFRRPGWSITPEREPVAAIGVAEVPEGAAPPQLAREFSAVIELPAELRDLPSPATEETPAPGPAALSGAGRAPARAG